MSKKAVVQEMDKDEIEKLKKRWKRVENIADGVLVFNSAGFATSLTVLDEFIDGGTPIIEIVTGALTAASFALKHIARSKYKEYEGKDYSTSEIDEEEMELVRNSVNEAVSKMVNSKQKKVAA